MNKTDALNGKKLRNDAQALLDRKCKGLRFRLKVTTSKADEEWTLTVVTPTRAGVHAYAYSKILSEVETQLRAKGYDHVLLLPDLPD